MTSKNVLRNVELKMSDSLGKPVHILSSDTLGGGCINHASKLQTNAGTYFLKWNASCPADMFQREAEGLQELKKAASNSLMIPEVICYQEVGEHPGFLVMEYFDSGRSGNDDEKLGRGLATIHWYKHDTFGFPHNNYCGDTPQNNQPEKDWITFFREHRLNYILGLIKQKRSLSIEELKVYDKLAVRLSKLIPNTAKPSLIHGDLWSGNYMLTSAGPALIDPATYYADREMEFGIVTMFGGFSSRFFDAYSNAFPLDPDWKDRNKLYQLYHILNHYYLFGGSYGSQAYYVAKSYL
ncbi:fructosamine kinase family protein [Maribellus sediminis]|uniref:fructosamine kinase family protein n=1 Tax=Maribellus sediminis TaxID=2696285 RepID=UPI001430F019|nr:fructosamine kinase family protein [Maribellus sediminis]